MAVVYVNDKPVDIGNEKLNLIQAAQKGGVFIPHYCWHPALTVVASCRMCLVEVGEKKPDGTVAMQPKVVPGCQTPAKDGTVIVTNSQKAKDAQEQTLEGLLLNHPLDCPVCDKAGECLLQDFSYGYGKSQSRMIDEKNTPPNKPHIGAQRHAVHRPLHHVLALRPLHARDQRHGRAAGHQPRRPLRDRHLPRRAARQQAGQQRRRSLPGRGPVQQGLPLQAARLVPQDAEQRLPRLLDRLQHPPRRQQEHRLPPAAAREPAGAGLFHVRRGPARLPLRQLEASASCGRWCGATAS